MRKFEEIFGISAERRGGHSALNALLKPPLTSQELVARSDDRFLSTMSKCVFNSGFNWKVVEAKWPGFEAAFEGFDLGVVAMFNDDDLARLVSDPRIVRHGAKIRAVQENAQFLIRQVRAHGSVGRWLAGWPQEAFVDLLEVLKKEGSRLGGNTGQYFLRFAGVDGFILSQDVVARLIAEGVVEKAPTSKTALRQVQNAFNIWASESGRSLTEISRVLAMSTG